MDICAGNPPFSGGSHVSINDYPRMHATAHIGLSSLQWRHNERGGISNHQSHDCLLSRLFRHRSKKTSKLRVTGFCVTGEFPAQRASNAKNVSLWWRHHVSGGSDATDNQESVWIICNMFPSGYTLNDGHFITLSFYHRNRRYYT